MNKENSKILIEKNEYMFSEMDRSIEVQKIQEILNDELVKAKIEEDDIKIAQIKEEQKEAGVFYPIAFGFECDDGWFKLLDDLMEKIKKVDKDRIVTIHQIKEKLGGLRFYTGNTIEEAEDLIKEACEKSYYICEVCGNPGELCEANKWYKTVCPEHRELETWAGIKQHYRPVEK
jgi:hypothetical protein